MNLREEAESEVFGSLIGDMLPQIKAFAPKIIKSLEESKEFLDIDEIIIIGKQSNGKIQILKGKECDVDIDAKEGKLQQYDLNFLIDSLFKKIQM